MLVPDDAFLRFLVSHSGQTIDFLPGTGGLDDALNSLAFHELCGRQDIACEPFSDSVAANHRMVVAGSVAVAARQRTRLAGRVIVVLPGSLSRFEEMGDGLDLNATVFWRDRVSLRMAELQGIVRERAVVCHDLAIHFDVSSLALDSDNGAGALTLDIHGQTAPTEGDRLQLRLSGEGDRWASLDQCRNAVRNAARLMADRGEITTDSPGLAIVAAKMGKPVRLSRGASHTVPAIFQDTIHPSFPAVTLAHEASSHQMTPAGHAEDPREDRFGLEAASYHPDEEIARLNLLLHAARHMAQVSAQERDRLFVVAADLRAGRDAETVAIVRSCRDAKTRAEQAECQIAERLARSEAHAALELEAATTAAYEARREMGERIAAIEGERDAAVRDAAAREAAAHEAAAREAAAHEAAAREAAAREAGAREAAAREMAERAAAESENAAREMVLHRRISDLNAAFDARSRQALSLQDTLDEREARASATEARVAQMRALIDARTTTSDQARRDADALQRRLDATLLSASWRITRPFRGVMRVVRRLTGARGRGRYA